METNGGKSNVYQLNTGFKKQNAGQSTLITEQVLSTINKTEDNVVKLMLNQDTNISINNKEALESKIVHRFSISQGKVRKTINIGLSIEEIEDSEFPTLEDVARDKYIRQMDSSDFDIAEDINFTLLGIETEYGFRSEKGITVKEM